MVRLQGVQLGEERKPDDGRNAESGLGEGTRKDDVPRMGTATGPDGAARGGSSRNSRGASRGSALLPRPAPPAPPAGTLPPPRGRAVASAVRTDGDAKVRGSGTLVIPSKGLLGGFAAILLLSIASRAHVRDAVAGRCRLDGAPIEPIRIVELMDHGEVLASF